MLKNTNHALKLMLLALLPMGGCVDDKYDLDDIDTTVEVKINDLVIPINIDKIQMSTILDLDSESRIQERDGSYVLIENGDINSGEINVPAISIAPPTIQPVSTEISLMSSGKFETAGTSVKVGPLLSSFEYEYNNVDNAITAMQSVGTDNFVIKVSLSLSDANSTLQTNIKLNSLTLQLPTGLEGTVSNGTYDTATGKVTFNEVVMTNGKFDFDINVSKINIASPVTTFDAATHTFRFATEIGIESIEVDLASIAGSIAPGAKLKLSVDFNLSQLNIKTFSGSINYKLEGFSINSVNLDNLPDILTQDETNIGISNPQIFLQLNNPLATYGLYATANMAITPYRNGEAGTVASPDNGAFAIGEGSATEGKYNYCLSPNGASQSMSGEYPNVKDIKFTSLSNILSGAGLPTSLTIDIEEPSVPNLPVTNFALGTNLGSVNGKYTFFAPLAFTADSKIVYTGTTDGWDNEDIEDLTINTLEVTVTVKNDLPISLELSATPLDKEGKPISTTTIEGAKIQGGTTQDVTIRATGKITDLDGLEYKAVGTIANPGVAIGPNQSIELSKIRAKVSGSYIKTL